jgi:hypothetical protein
MFITDLVDLPDKVVDAHAKDRLVFFVGAGASMDPPSSLPSFKKLAEELADAAHVSFNPDIPIDLSLGSMPPNFDTHAHAHRIVTRPDSVPNPTHTAIVRVASAIGPARIVTTNFDDHLSTAAAAEAIQVDDRWIGPALPLGDAFTGIAHLHGSVVRAPRELVLTDRDFGLAYLNDAWATRFLQKMFERYTVVFIGYSLDDPIMGYLSLGLPSRTRRYVFTQKPDEEKWQHLGIRPISYPGTDADHSALLAALAAWDSRARMGRLEHRTRMREIVDAGPSMTPVDRDYVKRRLRSVEGAADFAAAAATVQWLQWAEGRPKFKAMFSSGDETEASRVLADWYARTYIADPELHGAALQTAQRLGQRFSPGLTQTSYWAAERLAAAHEEAGRRWKTFLATSVIGASAPPDLGLMLPYQPAEREEPRAHLRVAVRPYLRLKRRWLLQDDDGKSTPDAELTWPAAETTLTEHLRKMVDAASPGDPNVGALIIDALNSAYDMLQGYHGERGFDPVSFGRSAIEPHPQDGHRGAEDALIDAVRDFGEKALPVTPGLAERWWEHGTSLFRRLALHLVAIDQVVSADEKLRWLLKRDTFYNTDEKHETYRVLAGNVNAASGPVRADVLIRAVAGPIYPDEMPDRVRHAAYSIYNLLAWLSQSAPDWAEASEAFASMQSAHPEFGVRENPDFDHWSSSGVWGGILPVDPEDFIHQADDDLPSAFNGLLNRDYSERNFDEPTWDDALSVVRRVAETRPGVGVLLWDDIEHRGDLGDRAAQLRRAIAGGWEKAELGTHQDSIVELVASLTPDTDSSRSVSQFLLGQIRKRVEEEESPTLGKLRDLARDLWGAQAQAFEHGNSSEPSFLALNSWPGELATFWVVEIDRRWRANRENWDGLIDRESEALLELLGGPPPTLDAIRPALASTAYFLFAADAGFTETNILPLFSDESTAGQMWGSFLYNPRTNDKMLSAGLLDAMVTEWAWLENLGDRGLQHQFLHLSASVVMFAGVNADDRELLLDRAVLAADGVYASRFASAIREVLDSENVDGAEVWDSWLRDHLTARLNGLPRTAEPEELARWADSVPFLGERIPMAITLVHDRGVGLGEQYHAPTFPNGILARHGQALIAHLAERVRNSAPTGWLQPFAVGELIESVRAVLGDAVQPLVDAARESGFNPGQH